MSALIFLMAFDVPVITLSSFLLPAAAGFGVGAWCPTVDGSTEIMPINTIPNARKPNATSTTGVILPVTKNTAATAIISSQKAE